MPTTPASYAPRVINTSGARWYLVTTAPENGSLLEHGWFHFRWHCRRETKVAQFETTLPLEYKHVGGFTSRWTNPIACMYASAH